MRATQVGCYRYCVALIVFLENSEKGKIGLQFAKKNAEKFGN